MTNWTVDIVEVGVIPDLPYCAYVPDAEPDRRLDIPCYSYLLTAPGHCFLVDSGPDPTAAAAAGFSIVGEPRRALVEALRRRERTPDDVRTILHTHLHYDHMQNDDLFPNATIVVHKREIQSAREGRDRFYVGTDSYLDTVAPRLRIIETLVDLDDGVRILPNGGHTPGHQSVVVTTSDGPICLCADIIPLAVNRTIRPPSVDAQATQAFMDLISRCPWIPLAGHDPALRNDPRYLHLDRAPGN